MVWGSLGALLEISDAIWRRFLAEMVPRGTQDGPSWQQVAPKMGHDGAKMAILGSVWSFLGGPGTTCGHFFRDLWKNGRSVKTNNTTALWVVFWGSGLPLEGPGGCLGKVLGAMLEDGGSKLVLSWLS